MGKGLSAALIAAEGRARMLKVATELCAHREPGLLPDVVELVQGMHTRLAEELMSIERFVTFTYARVFPMLNRLDFVECGCQTGCTHSTAFRSRKTTCCFFIPMVCPTFRRKTTNSSVFPALPALLRETAVLLRSR